MLINYVIIAFSSCLIPVVFFLILFKRKSKEHSSVIEKLEQKISTLVDDQSRALSDADLNLKTKEKELQDSQNNLIRVQEELKKYKAQIQVLSQQKVEFQEYIKKLKTQLQALSRYKGIVELDEIIAKKKRNFIEERNKALEK